MDARCRSVLAPQLAICERLEKNTRQLAPQRAKKIVELLRNCGVVANSQSPLVLERTTAKFSESRAQFVQLGCSIRICDEVVLLERIGCEIE